MITVKLNGKDIKTEGGKTILELARENGIEIPTLCHDEELKPFGSCWVCAVQVKGRRGFVTSCGTQIMDGMDIVTYSEEIKEARKMALELLLSDHYADCEAPCKIACPDKVDVQTYVSLIANGQYHEAVQVIKETLPMPLSIGRVCPAFCERECRRTIVDEPIAIRQLKRYAADFDLVDDWSYIPEKAPTKGKKIAIVAVDPSSPFSGGAVLGDRLRMQKHAVDNGVFIRSMASRGHLGGVSGAAGDVIKVLDAAGFDLIIIETIGVGQTEIDIVEMADIVLLVLVPGLGDEIQALKAGVMEIGDVFIVNKSDRDDAAKVQAEIEYVLHMKTPGEYDVPNPVVMTSALEKSGIDELLEQIEQYLAAVSENGFLEQKRKKRIARELKIIVSGKVREKVNRQLKLDERIQNWADAAYNKEVKPYAFINEQLKDLFK